MENKDTTNRAEMMRAHIAACQSEGMTVVAYCKEHGLVPSNYYYWQKKLNAVAPKAAFTKVLAASPMSGAAILHYPNGVRLELSSINTSVVKELICCI